MSDKLTRAQHTNTNRSPIARSSDAPASIPPAHARHVDPGSTSKIFVGGRHAGLDRTVIAAAVAEHVVPRPKPRIAAIYQEANDTTRRGQSTRPSVFALEHGEPPASIAAPLPKKSRWSAADPGSTSELMVVGKHTGPDRTRMPQSATPALNSDPGSTGALVVVGSHAGHDRTAAPAGSPPQQAPAIHDATASIGSSAALISICVVISRITGFARTWAMAFALGSTLLASSYTVANNLPNMLYELVVGGMLVTAFLPVYVSVKKKLGREASNEYASNLLTIVVVFLGLLSAFCIAFPSLVIYTQSFYSNQSEMMQSIFFFQFFAVQIVFYGASSIVSGLLNANRDYLWSSIAPVANNVIVIATFVLFAVIAPQNMEAALYIIAIGNPLGVFVQMAIQIPALRRNGIRLRPRINFRDPALRETMGIGIPAVFVMLCSFAVVSVQTAASYSFADNGPSVLAYARLWFTLPYAFLAVPITTAMFTELASMQAEGNIEGMKRGIIGGTNQILFFMIPFAMFLIVFSLPLVTLYHAGAFTMDNVSSIATYLAILALALPIYAINTYLQKIFSSLRKMGVFAGFNFIAGAAQIALTMYGAAHIDRFPLEIIAVAEILFYVIADICLFAYLRRHLGPFGLRSVVKACLGGILFGALGAGAGAGVLFALTSFVAPLSGSIPQALAYVAAGGVVSLMVAFGLAIKLRVPEATFISTLTTKVARKLKRG